MVKEIFVKTILNKHKVRDSWFLDDYSLNPYEACAFNCVFCYIRGSKYGENMQKDLSVKVNACQLLEKELLRGARKGEHGFIAISSSTEAWQPIEEKYQLTRKLLKIVLRYRFPVHVLTKSKLVLRDLDVLGKIDEKAILPRALRNKLNRGVLITFSLSTLDEKVAKIFEPGAPTPRERLETMQRCKENGFFTGVAYIPVLPFISDAEEQLEEMIKIAKEYGADYVFVGALTLFGIGKKFYYRILDKHFPDLVPRYRKLFRIFNQPSKEYQLELEKKTIKFCEKYNIGYKIM
jgi:DNA repair photolyase